MGNGFTGTGKVCDFLNAASMQLDTLFFTLAFAGGALENSLAAIVLNTLLCLLAPGLFIWRAMI